MANAITQWIPRQEAREVKATYRGNEVTLHIPVLGALVERLDNGYSPGVGSHAPFVVVGVRMPKTKGTVIPSSVDISPVLQVVGDQIAYDTRIVYQLKYYSNKRTSGWHTEADGRMYFYRWNTYEPEWEGDMK